MTTVATLGQGLSGVREETPDNLWLDVGRLYVGISLSALRAGGVGQLGIALATASETGATRGGAQFETGREIRMIEVDGKRFPIKGLNRVQSYEPALTISLLEVTRDNLKRSMSPMVESVHTAYAELELSLEIKDSDYHANIGLVTTLSGAADCAVLILENAMAVDSQQISLEDNNELVLETKFVGFADPATPHESPARIFYPLNDAS